MLDTAHTMFPSPHSGILFLSQGLYVNIRTRTDGFRPLIRGFFFYKTIRKI